jgi:hypothetical protein
VSTRSHVPWSQIWEVLASCSIITRYKTMYGNRTHVTWSVGLSPCFLHHTVRNGKLSVPSVAAYLKCGRFYAEGHQGDCPLPLRHPHPRPLYQCSYRLDMNVEREQKGLLWPWTGNVPCLHLLVFIPNWVLLKQLGLKQECAFILLHWKRKYFGHSF